MAELSIVEDPRPRRSRSNHPSHEHDLRKTDMREKYKWTNGLWRCDLCGIESNSNKLTSLHSTGHSENRDEKEVADSTFAFHCDICSYDVCSLCFYGRLHPFHNHKLKKAKVVLIYPETGGQWRCDACLKVFTELTAPMSNHCSSCEVDICDKCFIGSWKSVHHGSHHSLRPTDPRLMYRNYFSWICDVCEREFTFKHSETFFNCSICQYDICSDCFQGEKHHLHQHPLCLVNKATHGGDVCSNCSKVIVESHYRKCRVPDCCFSLCGLCYLSPPKYHPYHDRNHTFSLCDADTVYPQSNGLWHCDNCTRNHPYGEQTPLPSSQPMYHCDICDYDLCEKCYKRGLNQTSLPTSHSYQTPFGQSSTAISSGYYTDTNQATNGTEPYPYSHVTSTRKSLPYSNTSASNGFHMEQSTDHYKLESKSKFSHLDPTPHNGYHNPVSPVRAESLSGFTSNPSKHAALAPSRFNSHYSLGDISERAHGGESLRYSSLYGVSGSTGSVCMICRNFKATKYFCHGKSVMTCTTKPLVCERCAGNILMTNRSCPACGRIPDGVSDISF